MEDNYLEGDFARISSHNAPFPWEIEQNVETPPQDAFIHRIPIEILSSIFIIVKHTYDVETNEIWYDLPRQSTPLAFKAVCKSWWDVTMQTPQLWVDLILNITAPADVQLSMVNDWGHRSGALSLNLSIISGDSYLSREHDILGHSEEIIKTLRSFAVRWNHLFLRVPWSYSYNLLQGLEETSSLRSLYYVPVTYELDVSYLPIQLPSPLRLQRFHSMSGGIIPIPFVWNDLVHLEVNGINKGELLHIVRHASSLKHCETQMVYSVEDERYRVPTTPITNHSLIHLRTNHEVAGLLTLPSLQYLEYFTMRSIGAPVEPLAELIHRSSPPLQTLIFRSDFWPGELNACFDNLPTISHLSIVVHRSTGDYESTNDFLRKLTNTSSKVILPNLQEFQLNFPSLPPSSWSLLSRLFRGDETITEHGLDSTATSFTFGRPLSRVHMYVSGDGLEDETDKDPFLHLLTIKKTAEDLDLTLLDTNSEPERKLWGRMAEFCGISL